jgi:predicted DNA-binding transcriptional regulator
LSPEEVKVLNYAFWRGRMRLTDLINDLCIHENLARDVANDLIEKGFLKRETVNENININVYNF